MASCTVVSSYTPSGKWVNISIYDSGYVSPSGYHYYTLTPVGSVSITACSAIPSENVSSSSKPNDTGGYLLVAKGDVQVYITTTESHYDIVFKTYNSDGSTNSNYISPDSGEFTPNQKIVVKAWSGTNIDGVQHSTLDYILVDGLGYSEGKTINSGDTIYANGDGTVTAYFKAKPQYLVSFSVTEEDGVALGTISPSGTNSYIEGTVKTITATPNDGYKLSNIYYDGVIYNGAYGSINSGDSLTINANGSVKANFVSNRVGLSVSANPSNGGTFTISPLPDSDGKYANGTAVTITASPSTGYDFYSIAGVQENPHRVVLYDDTSVNIIFTKKKYTITCNFIDLESGGKIEPSATKVYEYQDTCTYTDFSPPSHYNFAWREGDPFKDFQVESDKQVSLGVSPSTYTVTYSVDPNGAGDISLSAISAKYNTKITIDKITANKGYQLKQISGNDSSGEAISIVDNSYFYLNDNITLVVYFELIEYDIECEISPTGSGKCTLTGTKKYNTSNTVLAVPTNGYKLDYIKTKVGSNEGKLSKDSLTDEGNGSYSYTFTADCDITFTAVFIKICEITFRISSTSAEYIKPSFNGTSFNGQTEEFDEGTDITLVAGKISSMQGYIDTIEWTYENPNDGTETILGTGTPCHISAPSYSGTLYAVVVPYQWTVYCNEYDTSEDESSSLYTTISNTFSAGQSYSLLNSQVFSYPALYNLNYTIATKTVSTFTVTQNNQYVNRYWDPPSNTIKLQLSDETKKYISGEYTVQISTDESTTVSFTENTSFKASKGNTISLQIIPKDGYSSKNLDGFFYEESDSGSTLLAESFKYSFKMALKDYVISLTAIFSGKLSNPQYDYKNNIEYPAQGELKIDAEITSLYNWKIQLDDNDPIDVTSSGTITFPVDQTKYLYKDPNNSVTYTILLWKEQSGERIGQRIGYKITQQNHEYVYYTNSRLSSGEIADGAIAASDWNKFVHKINLLYKLFFDRNSYIPTVQTGNIVSAVVYNKMATAVSGLASKGGTSMSSVNAGQTMTYDDFKIIEKSVNKSIDFLNS